MLSHVPGHFSALWVLNPLIPKQACEADTHMIPTLPMRPKGKSLLLVSRLDVAVVTPLHITWL